MTTEFWVGFWVTTLIVAFGFVAWSLCVISARAERDAERMSQDWREKNGTR